MENRSVQIHNALEKDPILLGFIQMGLANISAVAELLHTRLELDPSVSYSAVGMAIRRRIQDLIEIEDSTHWEFPDNLEISTSSQIYEIAFRQSSASNNITSKIKKSLDSNKGTFLSIFEGQYEVVVCTNQRNKSLVKKAIPRNKITSEVDDIAYVTVNWDKCTKDIPGIYFRITRALALKGISIQSFHTIGAEMMIMVQSENLSEAHSTLCSLLRGSSKN